MNPSGIGSPRLTDRQADAISLLVLHGWSYSGEDEVRGFLTNRATYRDSFGVYVNVRTASALERRGLAEVEWGQEGDEPGIVTRRLPTGDPVLPEDAA